MSFFNPKTIHYSVLYNSARAQCLGNIWFFSNDLKCFQPIRLQYSLIVNISGSNQSIPRIFCMVIITKERYHLRIPLFGGCGQLYLLSNQIVGSFFINISGRNQRISFCMEIIIKGRDFLHEHNHQWKVACETTSFGWVWPFVLLI